MLCVLAILSILMLLQTASFTKHAEHLELYFLTKTLSEDLTTARLQSYLLRRPVSVCPYAKMGCGNSWQTGWQIVSYKQKTKVFMSIPQLVKLSWHGGATSRAALRFLAGGFGVASPGKFILAIGQACSSEIIVAHSGRWRTIFSC